MSDKKPWEGEKPPAPATPATPPEPARTPPPPPPVAAAPVTPPPPAETPVDKPVANLEGVGTDDDARKQILDTVNGDQAPLELINLVSSGVPMAEARARLRLDVEETDEPEGEEDK